MHQHEVSRHDVEALAHFDTCTLSNAIETLNLRPRNEGYMRGVAHCMFPKFAPVAGFAATGRVRAAAQPVHGHYYYDHIEWWRYVDSLPKPRIIVLFDADEPPAAGALFGELHARICRALDCVAYITNGAVRDLTGIESVGFQVFAAQASVSHAYAHVVDFGHPVEVGGLRIKPGDLLHGDLHGVQHIPSEAAQKLPAIANRLLDEERRFIDECLDGSFSIDRFSASIRHHAEGQK